MVQEDGSNFLLLLIPIQPCCGKQKLTVASFTHTVFYRTSPLLFCRKYVWAYVYIYCSLSVCVDSLLYPPNPQLLAHKLSAMFYMSKDGYIGWSYIKTRKTYNDLGLANIVPWMWWKWHQYNNSQGNATRGYTLNHSCTL